MSKDLAASDKKSDESIGMGDTLFHGSQASILTASISGLNQAQVVVVGGRSQVLVWWTMDTAALASGRARFGVGTNSALVLRIYIESTGGRRSTRDTQIERWNGHLNIDLPSGARRVVAAIGFLGQEGFSHIARSAPIQRPRSAQSEAPLRTSLNRMSERGVSHDAIEHRPANEFSARLNRPFSGQSNGRVRPDITDDFISMNKGYQLGTGDSIVGEVSLCLVHEISGWTDGCRYVVDTCLPLVDLCRKMEADGIRFPVVLSLNANLLAYLASDAAHADVSAELKARLAKLKPDGPQAKQSQVDPALLNHERSMLERFQMLFESLNGDLVSEYRRLAQDTALELATTPLTSGSLTDIMAIDEALRLQILGAACIFRRIVGISPHGLILSNAGYMPSFNRVIADAGFRYTVVDAPGFRGATAPLQDGVYAPIHGAVTGLAAFVSHSDMHRWSGVDAKNPVAWYRQAGPGDLPAWEEAQWSGARETSPGLIKSRYDIQSADDACRTHALGWWFFQRERLRRASKHLSQPAHGTLVLSAAKLTQDWWEGPVFLEHIARAAHAEQSMRVIGLNERLDTRCRHQVAWPGPVVSSALPSTILPYALPRIAKAGRQVSQLLNSELGDDDGTLRRMAVILLNAFVMSHEALNEESRRGMERIRSCADLMTKIAQNTSLTQEERSVLGRGLFVEEDLAKLALI